MTSNLVAGVADTDCLQSCPLSSHSLGGRIESRISSVSVLALAVSLPSLPALLGLDLESSLPALLPFLP